MVARGRSVHAALLIAALGCDCGDEVDINLASVDELTVLPSVDAALAVSIVDVTLAP